MDRNEFFREAVLRMTSSLDIGHALERCRAYLAGSIPADIMQIHLWEPDLVAMRVPASVSRGQIRTPDELIPVPPTASGIPEWPQQENVKIINRVQHDPISASIQGQIDKWYGLGPCSHLVMRVQVEGKRICDIALMTAGNDRYEPHHANLLDLLHQPFGIAVTNALRHKELESMRDRLARRNDFLAEELERFAAGNVIGAGYGLREVMNRVDQVAATKAPVLLLGETGAGKDVIAGAIFERSRRPDQPFVRVNCGAIPESLLSSELFGHERGAFTDARERRVGRFERADGGTIFLDEVGELSPAAQVMLLRVLQDGEMERVGGTRTIAVDVRVIAATNRDLRQMVEEGRFRRDLYYRLNVFPVEIPALRQRRGDIPLLIDHFLQTVAHRMNIQPPRLLPGAMARLRSYDWPGNVRELANVVERAMIRTPAGPLDFIELNTNAPLPVDDNLFPACPDGPLPLDEVTRHYLQKVLQITGGKVSGQGGAAELLAVNPHTLRSRLRKLGVPFGRGAII